MCLNLIQKHFMIYLFERFASKMVICLKQMIVLAYWCQALLPKKWMPYILPQQIMPMALKLGMIV